MRRRQPCFGVGIGAALGVLLAHACFAAEPVAGWAEIEQRLRAAQASSTAPDRAPAHGGGGKAANPQWQEIEKRLAEIGGPTTKKPAAPVLSYSAVIERIAVADPTFWAPSPVSTLGFIDTREGQTSLVSANPILFATAYGRGTVATPIKLAGPLPMQFSVGRVAETSVNIAAGSRQLGVDMQNRVSTQAVFAYAPTSAIKLTLAAGSVSIERRSLDAFRTQSYFGYGIVSPDAGSGTTNLYGGSFDLSLFSGDVKVKAGLAQSRFRAFQPELAAYAIADPLQEMVNPVRTGMAQYFNVDLNLWKDEHGKLDAYAKWRQADPDFLGGSYEFTPGSAERSFGARGRWRWLSFDLAQQERSDATFGSTSTDRRFSAGLAFDWLELNLRRQQSTAISEYTYFSYGGVAPGGEGTPFPDLPVAVKNRSESANDVTTASLRLFNEDGSVSVNWRRNLGQYSYGSGAPSERRGEALDARAEYAIGSFGLQLAFNKSDDMMGVQGNPRITRRMEYGLTLSYDFKNEGHRYSTARAAPTAGYGAMGPLMTGATPTGIGPMAGTPLGATAAGAAPATATGSAPGNGLPAPGSPAAALDATGQRPPSRAAAKADGDLFDDLLPSSVRLGVRRGRMTQKTGDDGLPDYIPVYLFNNLQSPMGPFVGAEFGMSWNGKAGATDLALRVTRANGDERLQAAGGISYEFDLSHNLSRPPFSLTASLNGALSRFDPGSAVLEERYLYGSLAASYRNSWLTLQARLNGVQQRTVHADGEPPIPYLYATAELSAELTLDQLLFADWDREKKAPPYLRVRGYVARQVPALSYGALSANSQGFMVVGGARF